MKQLEKNYSDIAHFATLVQFTKRALQKKLGDTMNTYLMQRIMIFILDWVYMENLEICLMLYLNSEQEANRYPKRDLEDKKN